MEGETWREESTQKIEIMPTLVLYSPASAGSALGDDDR